MGYSPQVLHEAIIAVSVVTAVVASAGIILVIFGFVQDYAKIDLECTFANYTTVDVYKYGYFLYLQNVQCALNETTFENDNVLYGVFKYRDYLDAVSQLKNNPTAQITLYYHPALGAEKLLFKPMTSIEMYGAFLYKIVFGCVMFGCAFLVFIIWYPLEMARARANDIPWPKYGNFCAAFDPHSIYDTYSAAWAVVPITGGVAAIGIIIIAVTSANDLTTYQRLNQYSYEELKCSVKSYFLGYDYKYNNVGAYVPQFYCNFQAEAEFTNNGTFFLTDINSAYFNDPLVCNQALLGDFPCYYHPVFGKNGLKLKPVSPDTFYNLYVQRLTTGCVLMGVAAIVFVIWFVCEVQRVKRNKMKWCCFRYEQPNEEVDMVLYHEMNTPYNK